MPAIYDNSTTSNSGTFSHTVTSLGNRYLFVICCSNGGSGYSCTYGGVSLEAKYAAPAGDGVLNVWGMTNPLTGANNVVVSGASSPGIIAISYRNVHQVTPLGTAVTGTGTASSASSAPTTLATDIAVSFMGRPGAYSTFSHTVRAQSGGIWRTQAGEGAGPTPTLQWTYSASDWYIKYAVALLAAPEGALAQGVFLSDYGVM